MWNFFLCLLGFKPAEKEDFSKLPGDDINWGLSLGDALSNAFSEQEAKERQRTDLQPSPEVKRFQETQKGVDRMRQATMENIAKKSTLTGERLSSRTRQSDLLDSVRRDADYPPFQPSTYNHGYTPSPQPHPSIGNDRCRASENYSYNSNYSTRSCPSPSYDSYSNNSNYDSGSSCDSGGGD